MAESYRILVADDEPDTLDICSKVLKKEGREIATCSDGLTALDMLKKNSFDLLLLDIRMPEKDGMEVLKELREMDMDVDVIIITAYASIDTAVQAIKSGARDYLSKPFTSQELRSVVESVLERRVKKTERLPVALPDAFQGMIGKSREMERLYDTIEKVAAVNSNVLVEGESGTGKELVARTIHKLSPRSGGPFIPINCGALPENLLETELFGHTKGAFTGANEAKKGLFDAASGGTIFLDEVSETSAALQVKLLRVLQEKEIRSVGDVITRKVDCRVIAAANRDIEREAANGRFREDLYYRLSVVTIRVPPLRERKEDIPLLVQHFIDKYRKLYDRDVEGVAEDGMKALMEYGWPGNVRQLENLMERTVILERSKVISKEALFPRAKWANAKKDVAKSPLKSLEEMEKEYIDTVLTATNWNRSKAAEILGIGRRTLYEKMNKYGIQEGG